MKEIYQVLAGALGQETRLTQIANNLANVNTPGFKREGALFVNYLETAMAGPAGELENPAERALEPCWGALGSTYVDYKNGTFQPTQQPLDLAIEGEGFFMVEGPQGTAYTRAGNFRLNPQNELVTADGRRVLSAQGTPITLNLAGGKPEITSDGSIRVGRTVAGQLGVVRFADNRQLEKLGEGLFAAPVGVAAQPVAQPNVRQGWLESSNVNSINEMVAMIQAERAFNVDQKAMQTIDEITGRRIEAASR